MERHYLSHEMRNSETKTALCGLRFHPKEIDCRQGFSPGSCFPSRVSCRDCLEILDLTVSVIHWDQWVEIHPQTAGRETHLYTVFYPDRQVLRLDADTEVNLPCTNAPYQIWSDPAGDPETLYMEFQNLCDLRTLLATAAAAKVPSKLFRDLQSDAPGILEQVVARLE